MPAPIGNALFSSASLRNSALHRVQPLGFLRREVRRPAKSRFEIVELPDVLVRIPGRETRAHRSHGINGPKVQAYQPS